MPSTPPDPRKIYYFYGFGQVAEKGCTGSIYCRQVLSVRLSEDNICKELINEMSLGDNRYFICGVPMSGDAQKVNK